MHDRDDFIVVPVAAEAFVASRNCTRCAVINIDDLMGPQADLEHEFYVAIQAAERMLIAANEPWMRSFIGMEFHTLSIHVLAWDRLLSRVLERTQRPFELHPPAVFCGNGSLRTWGWDYRDRRAFWLCAEAMDRKGLVRVRGLPESRWRRRLRLYAGYAKSILAAVIGRVIVGAPSLFQQAGRAMTKRHEARMPTLLLAGVQHGDAIHQAPFAERLYTKYGNGFSWLSFVRTQESGMTPDEVALLTLCPNRPRYWIDADSQPRFFWRNTFIETCARDFCALRIARVLASCFGTSLELCDWRRWFCQSQYSELVPGYKTWEKCLDGLSPRVVVGFSSLQGMAFIRAWCLARKVPFVLLPHGIVTRLLTHVAVDGDYVGVYGTTMKEQIARSGLAVSRRVEACGPMQFGEKSAHSAPADAGMPSAPEGRVALYLVGFGTPLFPVTPSMRFGEIESVHRACLQTGCRLVVREHPRGGKDEYKAYVVELNRHVPDSVRVSTEAALSCDLSRARIVIASEYDGAFVDALMRDCLVVGYACMERRDEAVRQFADLGTLARTPDELARILSMTEGCGELREFSAKRQRYLTRLMGDRRGDAWSGAESVVALALREAHCTP